HPPDQADAAHHAGDAGQRALRSLPLACERRLRLARRTPGCDTAWACEPALPLGQHCDRRSAGLSAERAAILVVSRDRRQRVLVDRTLILPAVAVAADLRALPCVGAPGRPWRRRSCNLLVGLPPGRRLVLCRRPDLLFRAAIPRDLRSCAGILALRGR